MNIKKELIKSACNSIRLKIGGENENAKIGGTRFGGAPDVPDGFEWDYFEGKGSILDDTVKSRPLAFIAQFDLEEMAQYDADGLLPKTGVLSFFYEPESMRWGFDPKDKGCARARWFPDKNALHTAEFPDDLAEDYRFPMMKISASSELSYASYEDLSLQHDEWVEDWDEFESVEESLGIEEPDECSKLLGWANPIQGNMTQQCELISRGYYLGHGWDDISPRDRQESEQWANRNWTLLFQLDCIVDGNFELAFGDGGRIYFYIRREDLAAGNFDNVWLILQCS